MLSFFPRGVLDEILNLIESVSEGFPSYSCTETYILTAIDIKQYLVVSPFLWNHKVVLLILLFESDYYLLFNKDVSEWIYENHELLNRSNNNPANLWYSRSVVLHKNILSFCGLVAPRNVLSELGCCFWINRICAGGWGCGKVNRCNKYSNVAGEGKGIRKCVSRRLLIWLYFFIP